MQTELWPVVDRARLIQAFRPGERPEKEGPFRTLRAHGWATSGISVVTRSGRHASGRVTLFSILNVSAARCARDGDARSARVLARAAEKTERGGSFQRLRKLLSGRSPEDVAAAVSGEVSCADSPILMEALEALAYETRNHQPPARTLKAHSQTLTGRILEARDEGLVLEETTGRKTLVPRWLGAAAHRVRVGDALALMTDRLDDNQVVVQALPALELKAQPATASPFGRTARVLSVTDADMRLLSKRPAPIKPMLPVDFGE